VETQVRTCQRCGSLMVTASGFAHVCDPLRQLRPAVSTTNDHGYPDYGGGVALLLVCPGDGRHWINTTSSNPRIAEWEEQGRQVVGMASDRVVAERVVKSLGEFPRCGASVCKRCQTKK